MRTLTQKKANLPKWGNNARAVSKHQKKLLLKRFAPVYLLILPAAAFTFVFSYIPLGGLIVAFKDYDMFKGFLESPWAGNYGMANIIAIFQNEELMGSISNTVILSVLNLLISFPAPVILALMINELRLGKFKKVVQTISYMPHFLSWISVIGLTMVFFGEYGPINDIFSLILGDDYTRVLYLSKQEYFLPILLGLNLWKTVGWNSIIYIAAMAAVDPQLYEAAMIDGAGKWKQMLNITLPGISVTIILIFVMNIGGILNSNFELVFGLKNAFIDFETIDTVIYKNGLQQRGYSVATALGLGRGIIGLGLTLLANGASKKINGVSIF